MLRLNVKDIKKASKIKRPLVCGFCLELTEKVKSNRKCKTELFCLEKVECEKDTNRFGGCFWCEKGLFCFELLGGGFLECTRHVCGCHLSGTEAVRIPMTGNYVLELQTSRCTQCCSGPALDLLLDQRPRDRSKVSANRVRVGIRVTSPSGKRPPGPCSVLRDADVRHQLQRCLIPPVRVRIKFRLVFCWIRFGNRVGASFVTATQHRNNKDN